VCPVFFDPAQEDDDSDAIGNNCDLCPLDFDDGSNFDGDLVPDACDLCPFVFDNQADENGNGEGDACECPESFLKSQTHIVHTQSSSAGGFPVKVGGTGDYPPFYPLLIINLNTETVFGESSIGLLQNFNPGVNIPTVTGQTGVSNPAVVSSTAANLQVG